MERIMFDRNIVDLIVNEEVDDVMPMLPVAQANRVRNLEIRFWNAFKVKEDQLREDRDIVNQLNDNDR